MTPSRSRARQEGFSIIEMLVGVLIISFGLLGLVTLQARATQTAVGTEDAQRAALLASELAATMLNQNNVNLDPAIVGAWADRVADPASGGLPGGTATVTLPTATRARVVIAWTPPHASPAASGVHRYTTDVVVPQ